MVCLTRSVDDKHDYGFQQMEHTFAIATIMLTSSIQNWVIIHGHHRYNALQYHSSTVTRRVQLNSPLWFLSPVAAPFSPLPLAARRVPRAAERTFKYYYSYLHQTLPLNHSSLNISPNAAHHSYNTQNRCNLTIHIIRHHFATKCIRHSITTLISSLPHNISEKIILIPCMLL